MKKACLLACASLFVCSLVHAISLDDIQLWTGSGTNRAALVVQWNTPIVFNYTTVPAPVAEKTFVWGYRFNGTATGIQMLDAIVAANPRLYTVQTIYPAPFGASVDAIGYNLNGTGIAGVTDGTVTDDANAFTNGVLVDPNLNLDGAHSLNGGDLFWSGFFGPYWQLWTELGDNGGFMASPNRGTNQFWNPDTFNHGQWSSAEYGLNSLTITNGSWLGFSVSAAGYDSDTNDPAYTVFNDDEQAPPSPDGTYVAYVENTNDFAVQVINSTNLDTASPYNDPTAALGRPTLRFYDPYDGHVTNRVTLIDPPYNVTPAGSNVLTEIKNGGEITVKLGRRVYNNPGNPYGTDLIIYGYSFFSASGSSGFVGDGTDLNAAQLSSGYYSHPTVVSVSPDGANWYTYGSQNIFPDEAYRWDDTNDSWTDEQMNPTKPLNPTVYGLNFGGLPVASGLDQFMGAAGGTGYNLGASGFPWIQYVRVQPAAGQYAVIDAIAAVDPVVVGDALSIAPSDLSSGMTNLLFQSPARPDTNLITLNFSSVSAVARVYTVGLSDFSSFAPVSGNVSSAYQITIKPMTGTNAICLVAGAGLRAGDGYNGNGGDLRVYEWSGTNWCSLPFSYNPSDHEVYVSCVTNLSAFVVSQIPPPQLTICPATNGCGFRFTPMPNCGGTLQRSKDFVTWTPVCTFPATNAPVVMLQDTNMPAGRAFYRLLLNP